jgi:hypothetical protein
MDVNDRTWPIWLVALISLFAYLWISYSGAPEESLLWVGSH